MTLDQWKKKYGTGTSASGVRARVGSSVKPTPTTSNRERQLTDLERSARSAESTSRAQTAIKKQNKEKERQARTAESLARAQMAAAPQANISPAGTLRRVEAPDTTPYSLMKSIGGLAQKGIGGLAQHFGDALALGEDVVLAPFELFSGQELGALSDHAPLNAWAKNIRRENENVAQYYQENMDKGGTGARLLEELGSATIAAVPQAVLAMLTGGTSAAAQTAQGVAQTAARELTPGTLATVTRAVSSMAKDPQYWTAFSQVVGSSYEDALADGTSRPKAALYAVGNGLFNAAVEVGGGIQTLPAELRQGGKALRTWIDSMVDEGKEEVVQGVIERALQNGVYGKGSPLASVSDPNAVFNPATAAREFAGGAVVGGVLGGGQMLASKAIDAAARPSAPAQAQDNVLLREVRNSAGQKNAAQRGENAAVEGSRDFLEQQLFGQQKNASGEAAGPIQYTFIDGSNTDGKNAALASAYQQTAGKAIEIPDALVQKYSNINNDPAQKLINVVKQFYEKHLKGQQVGVRLNNGVVEIMFENDGKKKATGWRMKPEKAASFERLLDLVKNSEYAYSEVNRNANEATSIPRFHYFTARAIVDGVEVPVKIQVRDVNTGANTQETHYYTHNLQNKRGSNSPVAGAQSANIDSNAYTSSLIDPTIAQEADSVNPSAGVDGQGDEGAVRRDDSLGSARAGFTTPGMAGTERVSRLQDSLPYDRYQGEATGMSREDYAKLFRYESQTEGRSMSLADDTLYLYQDGERRFIRDVDENSYHELVESLKDATAWNAPQTDAAELIRRELEGRAVNLEIDSGEYADWISTMREHATAGGQGTQAWSKWSRSGTEGRIEGEAEAWDNLQKSKLSQNKKTEVFRKILQWNNQIESTENGDTAALKDVILDVARQRGVLDGLTGKQSTLLRKIAGTSLDSMSFDQLKSLAYASTSALSTDAIPANAGQKLKTIQILNMLSSPKTAAKNIAGNTTFYGIDAAAMRGAAILDMALSKLTGTRSVAFEQGTLSRASREAAVKAMQMAAAEITLDVNMDGAQSRYGTASSRTFKAGGSLADRVLSALERNQAYLLNATDELYKGAARSTAERTQALVDQGRIKTEDQDYAAKQAEELAKYRTFQDNSKLSVGIQTIRDVLNMIGVGDSGRTVGGHTVHSFGAGDVIAPFTRVAGNLASRGLEYSPVNAVRGTLELAGVVAQAARGNVDAARQAKAVSNLARGMTGTAIAYGFMLLAQAGLLRQADDEDDADVRALNQAEGITGTQLNLSAAQRALSGEGAAWRSGDTLIDLSSIEPLNLLMNLGTEMAKSEASPIVTAWNATSDSFMDVTAELPVMQSIGNAAVDIVRYNQDPKEVFAKEAMNTLVSSTLPNLMRSAARGLDDRPRSTYSGDTLAERLRDNVKSGVPGLRETLPGSVDGFGRDRTYQGSRSFNLFQAMLNPVGVNTYTQGEVSKELEAVRKATGDTSFYPDKSAPSKLKADGKELPLTYEQRQEFQRTRGSAALLVMGQMMGADAYKQSSDEQKSKLLSDCSAYAYQAAKAEAMGRDSVDEWVLNAQNAQRDLGISTADFIALRQRYGEMLSGKSYEKVKQAAAAGLSVEEYAAMQDGLDADGNGGVSQAEAQAYLDAQEFSREQKADLWSIINKGWKKNPYA
ncbi:hypothetical protein KQI82_06320 [Oscillibacter sp. MSJ-2]|uniref:Large polyvalent protein-associated domain-containing protein n=1 Tax=Dysosmobacter acutus TaxID=2841504 RepID=A0ABS6F8C1_9FIRM|nr:hypothetical protein [Dysosmobacter acutus]MBU5626534.1 hypothetical protein [Dysosmobacter acutus]